MLSEQTIAIVKATAPILAEHGETLTRHFYKRMFSHNPEVIPFFNQSNQVAGSQQKALAGAICAYAANIDNLGALGGAVELIAQKHASLQVKAEHYPIVGENLLASIKEVLGDGATDAVINAWAEAYGFLAEILIGREGQIYQDNAHVTHGWDGFKPFVISKKIPESSLITSFYLVPKDGDKLPSFKPGQYLTLRFKTADSKSTTMRNYSLSGQPVQGWFRISVKRESGSKAHTPEGYVSNLLHDHLDVGAELEVAAPYGEFFIDTVDQSERPLVFLAGGIGITPIISMLQSLLNKNIKQNVVLIYGSTTPKAQAFKEDLDRMAAEHSNFKIHYRYSESAGELKNLDNVSEGMVDAALIESMITDKNADYYFCGPKPFMANIYNDLLAWGILGSQVHFEFFGPLQELKAAK